MKMLSKPIHPSLSFKQSSQAFSFLFFSCPYLLVNGDMQWQGTSGVSLCPPLSQQRAMATLRARPDCTEHTQALSFIYYLFPFFDGTDSEKRWLQESKSGQTGRTRSTWKLTGQHRQGTKVTTLCYCQIGFLWLLLEKLKWKFRCTLSICIFSAYCQSRSFTNKEILLENQLFENSKESVGLYVCLCVRLFVCCCGIFNVINPFAVLGKAYS